MANKSSLPILGEFHFTFNFDKLNLPITALVIEKLDCDILVGIPFCKTKDIHIHLRAETISIGSTVNIPNGFRYLCGHANPHRMNDIKKVVTPSDYVEFKYKIYNSLMVRLRLSHIQAFASPNHGPSPRFPELLKVPYKSHISKMNLFRFTKAQHIAQIRPVIIPDESTTQTPSCEVLSIPKS